MRGFSGPYISTRFLYFYVHVHVRFIFASAITLKRDLFKEFKDPGPPDINVTPILNYSLTCLVTFWPVVIAYRCAKVTKIKMASKMAANYEKMKSQLSCLLAHTR